MSFARLFSTKSTQRFAIAIRLLLLLSVWSGPIPLGHDHLSMMNSSNDATIVAKHVAIYHASTDCGKRFAQGWHLHWVFPDSENSGFEDCAPTISLSDSRLAASSSGDWLVSDLQFLVPAHWMPPVVWIESNRSNPNASPCFATGKLSLPECLGIMRC